MAKGFKHGAGGGTSLNFDVKAYPSETELKAATPSENTIGVITTTTISSWIFSATEPTEPVVGMVWFRVGTFSTTEFNVLKNNTIQVYPQLAKQYVGEAFTDVTAMSYQNGEWVAWWGGELYTPGNEWKHITGGWKPREWTIHPNNTPCLLTVDKTDSGMVVHLPAGNDNCGAVEILNDVDVTDFSAIEFIASTTSKNPITACDFAACDRTDAHWGSYGGADAYTQFDLANVILSKDTPITMDLSAVTGKKDIVFGMRHYNSNGTAFIMTVHSVRLVR